MSTFASRLPAALDGTVVRRFQLADLERFHGYRKDPELARYQGWSAMTLAQARAFVEEMAGVDGLRPGAWIQLAVAELETDILIGDIGVYLEGDGSLVELGFTLCRDAHGKGHATRAVQAAVSLAFAASNVHTVRAITDTRNTKSIRVLERAAFVQSHVQEAVFKGAPCSELIFVRHCEQSHDRSSGDPPTASRD